VLRGTGSWYICVVDLTEPTQAPPMVVCGVDGDEVAAAVTAARAAGRRVGAFIGDPDDPEVHEAAVVMARELFGDDAVVVTCGSDARQSETRSGTV